MSATVFIIYCVLHCRVPDFSFMNTHMKSRLSESGKNDVSNQGGQELSEKSPVPSSKVWSTPIVRLELDWEVLAGIQNSDAWA